jgi:hypothetical protein
VRQGLELALESSDFALLSTSINSRTDLGIQASALYLMAKSYLKLLESKLGLLLLGSQHLSSLLQESFAFQQEKERQEGSEPTNSQHCLDRL